MSDMNLLELVSKIRTDAGIGDDQKGFLTEQASAAAVGSTPVLYLSKEHLEELIIGALRDAPADLTDEEICAVVALRLQVDTATFDEQMLLEREIEAHINDKNGSLTDANNYSFRRRIPKSEDSSIDKVPPAE